MSDWCLTIHDDHSLHYLYFSFLSATWWIETFGFALLAWNFFVSRN
jgi:hypothetical protein